MRMRDPSYPLRYSHDRRSGSRLAATSVGDGMTALPIGLRLTCCSSKLIGTPGEAAAPARISNKTFNNPILKRVKTDHHQSTPFGQHRQRSTQRVLQ